MTQPPIVLVSPDMRPSVMGVARSLTEAGLLQRFVTTVAVGNGGHPTAISYLPAPLRKKVQAKFIGRQIPDFLKVPVETFPSRELMVLAGRRAGLSDLASHHLWEWAETSFDNHVAARWAGQAPVIYGCEHASVETFRRQKEAGGLNILWQVIAHHRTAFNLLREEYEKFPEAVTPYISRMFRDAQRINERKDRQFDSADLIVTNSEFSRQTFIDAGISADKVKAIPTGCPPVATSQRVSLGQESKMIFLSAGTQSVRKGIPYLLRAWQRLPATVPAELWLVGNMELPERLLNNLPASIVIKPSVARAELKEIFAHASVLVLPTLCEGLAHVILEAMAAGLAVITTENSGCGTLVEDGVNGWKVPVCDANTLAGKIIRCVDEPDAVEAMGAASIRKAQSWQEKDFGSAHLQIIEDFLCRHRVGSKELKESMKVVSLLSH
jgi:glycosyltransferase involved in cell wall biosynthesis